MMYAILSDVHGNLEALEAVLEDCRDHGVERILFLGDAVGYGADPGACLDLLRHTTQIMIMGNHDIACATGTDLEGFNENASKAILWTRDHLPREELEFLTSLPMEHLEEDMHLVHGSPCQPHHWHYIMSEKEAEKGFASSESRIIFVGHSHIPMNCIEIERKRVFGGEIRRIELNTAGELHVSNDRRYIVNVGSVGQPRDHDPRAAYGLYDAINRTFLLRRVSYDWGTASDKILDKGLPTFLARRITEGL